MSDLLLLICIEDNTLPTEPFGFFQQLFFCWDAMVRVPACLQVLTLIIGVIKICGKTFKFEGSNSQPFANSMAAEMKSDPDQSISK